MKYTEVGKIRRAHGIRGEVFLISFSKSFDWIEEMKEVRLVQKKQNPEGEWEKYTQSFPIKKKKPHKVGYILDLEGLSTRNQAEDLEGAVLELALSNLKTSTEEYYLAELVDFEVYDQDKYLGKVTSFSSNTAQDLLVVSMEEKQIEIPNIAPIVETVDLENKKIYCSLPEGFLDL